MHFIKSNLLNRFSEVIHGFSTKEWGNMSFRRGPANPTETNNKRFLSKLGVMPDLPIFNPSLNHGNTVALLTPTGDTGYIEINTASNECLRVSKRIPLMPPQDLPYLKADRGIDACWVKGPNVFLTMRPADCAIVYFYDPVKQMIGLAHAGTAGVFSGIVMHMIDKGREWAGVEPQNLFCYISPGIRRGSYDLTRTGAWKVLKSRVDAAQAVDYDSHDSLKQQLIVAGVPLQQIEANEMCTADRTDLFFSHHAAKTDEERLRMGRMMAIIGLKPNDNPTTRVPYRR